MPRLPALSTLAGSSLATTLAWSLLAAAVLFIAALAAADERARLLWINSLLLGASVAAIAVPIGTLLAILIGRCEVPGRSLTFPLLAFSIFLPLYLHAAGWQAGFGTQGWFTLFFWPEGIPPPLFAWRGAIAIHSLVAIPWVVLMVMSGLSHSNPEPEEAAALEGGNAGVLMYVTLPLLAPQIALAALWVLVSTIGEMTVTDLFAVRTIAEEVFLTFARDSLEEAELAIVPAIAGVGLLVIAAAMVATSIAPWEAPIRAARRWKLGLFSIPAAVFVLGSIGLLVAVPIGNLAVKGGWLVISDGETRTRVWSLAALIGVVAEAPWRYRSEIQASLLLGFAAASAAWILSLAAWIGRRGGISAGLVLAVAAIGLALPGPFIGMALIRVFDHPDLTFFNELYSHSPIVMILAQAIRSFPLVLLLVWQAFASLPREMEELAALDGARFGSLGASVVLPARWPALTCAWVAGLALAMGDLAGSVLVRPPGVNPVSWTVFDLLHSGVDDRLAGLCIVWTLLFAGLTALGVVCYHWQRDEKRQENVTRNQSASEAAEGL